MNRDLSLLEKIKENAKLVLFAGFPVRLCLGERREKNEEMGMERAIGTSKPQMVFESI